MPLHRLVVLTAGLDQCDHLVLPVQLLYGVLVAPLEDGVLLFEIFDLLCHPPHFGFQVPYGIILVFDTPFQFLDEVNVLLRCLIVGLPPTTPIVVPSTLGSLAGILTVWNLVSVRPSTL